MLSLLVGSLAFFVTEGTFGMKLFEAMDWLIVFQWFFAVIFIAIISVIFLAIATGGNGSIKDNKVFSMVVGSSILITILGGFRLFFSLYLMYYIRDSINLNIQSFSELDYNAQIAFWVLLVLIIYNIVNAKLKKD
jgi:hypothetical protein